MFEIIADKSGIPTVKRAQNCAVPPSLVTRKIGSVSYPLKEDCEFEAHSEELNPGIRSVLPSSHRCFIPWLLLFLPFKSYFDYPSQCFLFLHSVSCLHKSKLYMLVLYMYVFF